MLLPAIKFNYCTSKFQRNGHSLPSANSMLTSLFFFRTVKKNRFFIKKSCLTGNFFNWILSVTRFTRWFMQKAASNVVLLFYTTVLKPIPMTSNFWMYTSRTSKSYLPQVASVRSVSDELWRKDVIGQTQKVVQV